MMLCFLLNEDLSRLLLTEWIDFRSMGTLDMAITNRIMRILWLQRLRSITAGDVNNWLHGHSSMRWLITRGLQAAAIEMNSKCSNSITHLTFEGIDGDYLRIIRLSGCIKVTDAGVSAIGHGCPLLQKIDLSYCDITDASVSATADGCPLLQVVNLSYCDSITDAGVAAIGHGCPLLQAIDLRELNVLDAGVSALAHGCPLLQHIDVSSFFMCRITDLSVSALAQGCPQLESVHLGCCRVVSDAGLCALQLGCPRLRMLNLHDVRSVTDEGVSALVRGCPLLENINLGGCFRVTDAGVCALQDRYPLLEIHYIRQDLGDY